METDQKLEDVLDKYMDEKRNDENTIIVGRKNIMDYVSAAIVNMDKRSGKNVKLVAVWEPNVGKAVSIAEALKHNSNMEVQSTRFGTLEGMKDGRDGKPYLQKVTTIEIALIKKQRKNEK